MGIADWFNRKAVKGLAKTFGIQYRRYQTNGGSGDIDSFKQIFWINRFWGTQKARDEALKLITPEGRKLGLIDFLIHVLNKENSWDESDRAKCTLILRDELIKQGFSEEQIYSEESEEVGDTEDK